MSSDAEEQCVSGEMQAIRAMDGRLKLRLRAPGATKQSSAPPRGAVNI
jgi:hypothetical protein